MSYSGFNGEFYKLADEPFAGGGEGDIYEIVDRAQLVAKKYKPANATLYREAKIKAMLTNPPPAQDLAYFAWPVDLLYENKLFTGYVMPNLQDLKTLSEVYEREVGKDKPWGRLISIARNLAEVIHKLHELGHVCGDLSPDNISIDKQGGITLIDTDSYHIFDKINNQTLRCDVAQSIYIPFELQGIYLSTAPLPTFTKATDSFALAVLIFRLLMNGAHPFASAASPQPDKPVKQNQVFENIKKGFSPILQNEKGDQIPIYAPPRDILTSELQELFKKAFIDGHTNPEVRPQASEWRFALDNLNQSLQQCADEERHLYRAGLNNCPWCGLNDQSDNDYQREFSSDTRLSASEPGPFKGEVMPDQLLGDFFITKAEEKRRPRSNSRKKV